MGNEMREEFYWREKEKRKCRLCEWKEETWKNIWEDCVKSKR